MYSFKTISPAVGIAFNNLSGTRNIDALLSGDVWNSKELTFAFPKTVDYYGPDGTKLYPAATTFSELGESHKQSFISSVKEVNSFANLTIKQASDNTQADIIVAGSGSLAKPTAAATSAFEGVTASRIWLSTSVLSANYEVKIGSFAHEAIAHELGHALGLEHGHDTDGSDLSLDPSRDSPEFSIMTYTPYVGSTGPWVSAEFGHAQTFMMYDIAAIQFMYGANFTSNAGNNVYTFSSTTGEMFIDGVTQGVPGVNQIFRTIWDGNGVDTYYLGNYINNLVIDLTPGGWSVFSTQQLSELGDGVYARGNVFNALLYQDDVRSLIENAHGGSGNDTITGNRADNSLYGNAGNDTLSGGAGVDHLYGGAGADVHNGGIDVVSDYVRYDDTNHGNLVINLSNTALNTGAAKGDTYININGIVGGVGNDTITGAANYEHLKGGAGDDRLYGLEGDDILVGEAGVDFLYGGAGADQHFGGDGAGIDLARYDDQNHGNLTINLGDSALNNGAAAVGDTYNGIEGLVGGAGNDVIVGDSGNNMLYGQAGADNIRGLLGNDTLFGGLGADWFYFTTTLNATTNVDGINDFNAIADTIALSKTIFAKIGTTISAGEFRLGTVAKETDDFIIYDRDTGKLFYDTDGSGTAAQTLFATVSVGTVLDVSDFVLV